MVIITKIIMIVRVKTKLLLLLSKSWKWPQNHNPTSPYEHAYTGCEGEFLDIKNVQKIIMP